MPHPRCPDAEFIRLVETIGIEPTARQLGLTRGAVYQRRRNMERKYKRQIKSGATKEFREGHGTRCGISHPDWLTDEIENGIVLVGSDAHYWPGIVTTAHRGFVKLCKELKPRIVIMNGDILDGASISRHPPIGWEDRPSLIQELEASQERLGEIERAAGKARKLWPLGNHDGRFETRLATVAPEYARVHGVHLKDHFPLWEPCWSVCLNGNIVIKHRYKGGVGRKRNNALNAGMHMVTSHWHGLGVEAVSNYQGTWYGVDTGTLAEPYGPQFRDYTEENPLDWRSGFVALEIWKRKLLWPDVAFAFEDGKISFRGRVIEV